MYISKGEMTYFKNSEFDENIANDQGGSLYIFDVNNVQF